MMPTVSPTDRSVFPGNNPAPGLVAPIWPMPELIPELIELTPEPTPDVIDPTPVPTPEVIEPTPEPIEPMAPFKGVVRPRFCACATGPPCAANSSAAAAK
jgi:hypothetical protein